MIADATEAVPLEKHEITTIVVSLTSSSPGTLFCIIIG